MALRELKLEITQQCPLACIHCSTESHRRRTSALPEETVFRIINEAAVLGVQKIAFSGGEPLLAPYLAKAIQRTSELGIYSSLYTCGVADFDLSPLSSEAATRLAESGLNRFIFSIYSLSPEVHNSITGMQSLSATVVALQNASTSGAQVEIHFVAMRRNFRELPGLVEAADRWGVGRVSVLRFVPHGRGSNIADREDLTTEEMRELRQIIITTRAKFPEVTVRAGSPYNVLGIGHTRCDAAQDVLTINHRGDIFPCDAFKNVEYPDATFGSVLNRPLQEVWEKSAFLNRVREELAAGPAPLCGSCSEFSGCRSGCLAQKVIREGWGGTSNPDPGCLVQISGTKDPASVVTDQSEALVHTH